jgi:hypothetical protein
LFLVIEAAEVRLGDQQRKTTPGFLALGFEQLLHEILTVIDGADLGALLFDFLQGLVKAFQFFLKGWALGFHRYDSSLPDA